VYVLFGCTPARQATGPALGEGEDAEPVTARAGLVGSSTVLHWSGYRERAEYAAGGRTRSGQFPRDCDLSEIAGNRAAA
jgi:hypothetical protein